MYSASTPKRMPSAYAAIITIQGISLAKNMTNVRHMYSVTRVACMHADVTPQLRSSFARVYCKTGCGLKTGATCYPLCKLLDPPLPTTTCAQNPATTAAAVEGTTAAAVEGLDALAPHLTEAPSGSFGCGLGMRLHVPPGIAIYSWYIMANYYWYIQFNYM